MYFHRKFTSSSFYNNNRKHKKRKPTSNSSRDFKTIGYTGWFVFYDLWVKFLQVLSCD